MSDITPERVQEWVDAAGVTDEVKAGVLWTLPDDMPVPMARLLLAAPDIARAYLDKCAEVERLNHNMSAVRSDVGRAIARAERAEAGAARLTRILACERGDESAAPAGWEKQDPNDPYGYHADNHCTGVWWAKADAAVWQTRDASAAPVRYLWMSANLMNGRADTLLEAMEAADAALRGEE